MPRKSGKDGMVEVELGATYFPMQALSSVSSPASAVNKKFTTGQTYISPIEDYEPNVRLDGVVSGLLITASINADEVDFSAGEVNVKGEVVQVTAGQVSSLTRPAIDGNIVQNAIVVDGLGAVTAEAVTEGATSNTRGAAGGPPGWPPGPRRGREQCRHEQGHDPGRGGRRFPEARARGLQGRRRAGAPRTRRRRRDRPPGGTATK